MTTNKQIIEVADQMAKAMSKLTDGLAKDGVALDGFVDAVDMQQKWAEIKLKRQMDIMYAKAMKLGKQVSTKPCMHRNVLSIR